MAESIAQQVKNYLVKKPNASNADLYAKFPDVRENTLRNYKSKFKNTLPPLKVQKASSAPKKKTAKKENNANSSSLRGRVFEFFKQNPKATNQNLYEEFSNYSKNKLRHYKASFFKSIEAVAEKSADSSAATFIKRKKSELQETVKEKGLEKRIKALENQVKTLTKLLDGPEAKKGLIRGSMSDAASTVEKRFKDLELNLTKFIADKRHKIKSEMSILDDVQQLVTDKLNTILKSIKDKD